MHLKAPTALILSPWLGVFALALSVCLHAGCKAHELTSHGTEVTLLGSEPIGCEELGEVVAYGGGAVGGYSKKKVIVESATNKARNQAAEMGATHILLEEPELVHGTGKAAEHDMQPAMGHGDGTAATATVRGIAYKCPPGVEPPSVAESLAGAGLPKVENPPAAISLLPLGKLERIIVFQRLPATPTAEASELEVLRLEDEAEIQQVAESLSELALDPLKYVPTHRVELVGELGTQSLLYGFGYLKYANATYRLTTGTFERVLQLVGPRAKPADAEPSP
jgi:hypothetical protein